MKQVIYNKLEQHRLAGWLVFTAMRLESIAETNIMKPMGLTASSFRILMALHSLGSQTSSELTETLGTSKSNLAQRLAWLQKKGFITMKRNRKGDRRLVSITITSIGEEKLLITSKLIKDNNLQVEKYFNEKETQELLRLLRHINSCLDSCQTGINKIYEQK